MCCLIDYTHVFSVLLDYVICATTSLRVCVFLQRHWVSLLVCLLYAHLLNECVIFNIVCSFLFQNVSAQIIYHVSD